MRLKRAPLVRSTTATELLPSSATNSRLRGRSMARWSILPTTFPSTILLSRNGFWSAACATAPTMQSAAAPSIATTLPKVMRSTLGRSMNRIESGPQPLRELHRVVVSPKVNEERARLLADHVIVDRGHLDPVVTERGNQRVYFVRQRNEVSGNRRLAAASWLEVDCD